MNPGNKKAPAPVTTLEGHGEQLSFLPPVPFCPTWPSRGTLSAQALEMLMEGRVIDHLSFLADTGCWCLRSPIADLRDMGWPVESISIPSPTQTTPHRTITIYRLDGKYISLALALKNGRAA